MRRAAASSVCHAGACRAGAAPVARAAAATAASVRATASPATAAAAAAAAAAARASSACSSSSSWRAAQSSPRRTETTLADAGGFNAALTPDEAAVVAREERAVRALAATLRAYTAAADAANPEAAARQAEATQAAARARVIGASYRGGGVYGAPNGSDDASGVSSSSGGGSDGGVAAAAAAAAETAAAPSEAAAKEDEDVSDVAMLIAGADSLRELFLLVICGEFNSGKSTVLNALLGDRFLRMGITPTTSKIGLVRHGEGLPDPALEEGADLGGGTGVVADVRGDPESEEREIVKVPVSWLKDISLVDTPGTNAVVTGHQQITEHFVPRADLVLFVTSADRAFTNSERQFLELIRTYRKKVVVVLSKADMLMDQREEDEVTNFVRTNFHDLLGMRPQLFAVSGRSALRAKMDARAKARKEGKEEASSDMIQSSPHWEISRFGQLEDFILRTLSSRERLKIKLANPLGLGQHLTGKYLRDAELRRAILAGDESTLDHIERAIKAWEKDTMSHDFSGQAARIDNELLEMKTRGQRFLEDELQLVNVPSIVIRSILDSRSGNKDADVLRKKFEDDVLKHPSEMIEKHSGRAIEWLLGKSDRLWRDVAGLLEQRAGVSARELAAARAEALSPASPERSNDLVAAALRVDGSFDVNRMALLERVTDTAGRAVSGAGLLGGDSSSSSQSARLAQSVRQSLVATAGVELSAVGVGGLIGVFMFDFTGLFAASALAAAGLGILPYRRRQLTADFSNRVDDAREALQRALRDHFEDETVAAAQRVRERIEPYRTFTLARSAALDEHAAQLTQHAAELRDVNEAILKTFGADAVDRKPESSTNND